MMRPIQAFSLVFLRSALAQRSRTMKLARSHDSRRETRFALLYFSPQAQYGAASKPNSPSKLKWISSLRRKELRASASEEQSQHDYHSHTARKLGFFSLNLTLKLVSIFSACAKM